MFKNLMKMKIEPQEKCGQCSIWWQSLQGPPGILQRQDLSEILRSGWTLGSWEDLSKNPARILTGVDPRWILKILWQDSWGCCQGPGGPLGILEDPVAWSSRIPDSILVRILTWIDFHEGMWLELGFWVARTITWPVNLMSTSCHSTMVIAFTALPESRSVSVHTTPLEFTPQPGGMGMFFRLFISIWYAKTALFILVGLQIWINSPTVRKCLRTGMLQYRVPVHTRVVHIQCRVCAKFSNLSAIHNAQW